MAESTLQLVADRNKGRRLGKYEVLSRLSTGGMSEIFLASQRGVAGFRKLVVLKQILPDIKAEEDVVKMFLDEARITAMFSHPNIAQVYDLDTAEGELFLAMEFVTGATLIEVAKACKSANEPIPIGFSTMAARDTALALHYAHTFTDPAGRSRPVIHRDVAEKNIMVTFEGTTKLLDFGIAKAKGRSSHTAAGKVKGTSGYMSPEQVMGDELDARSDIFSLGVVLHELLTGMRLFYAKDPEEGMRAALHAQPPPPSAQNPNVPRELDQVVLKALARERQQRFGSALEMARAIERALPAKIWHPEVAGAFIQRHFADRREQTRALLQDRGDVSGEYSLAGLSERTVLSPAPVSRDEAKPKVAAITGPVPRRPAMGPSGALPPPPQDLARFHAGAEEDPERTRIKPKRPRLPTRSADDEQTLTSDKESAPAEEQPTAGTEPSPSVEELRAAGIDGTRAWKILAVGAVLIAAAAGFFLWLGT